MISPFGALSTSKTVDQVVHAELGTSHSPRIWHLKRYTPNQPAKARVPYRKLLRCFALNESKSKPEEVMARKNTFRKPQSTKFFQTTNLDWVNVGLQYG